jgi:hypothetical protein
MIRDAKPLVEKRLCAGRRIRMKLHNHELPRMDASLGDEKLTSHLKRVMAPHTVMPAHGR